MDVGSIGPSGGSTSGPSKPQAIQVEDKKKLEELQSKNSDERRQDEQNVEAKAETNNLRTRGGNIDTYA